MKNLLKYSNKVFALSYIPPLDQVNSWALFTPDINMHVKELKSGDTFTKLNNCQGLCKLLLLIISGSLCTGSEFTEL